MDGWVDRFGMWAVMLVAFAPIVDHPIIAVAALTGMAFPEAAIALLVGKTLKFFALAFLVTFAPETLKKLKIIKD